MSHMGRRLSAFVDNELSHAQRDRVLAHLAGCQQCRQEAVALRVLKQRMLAMGEATACAALTDRLMALAGLPGPPGQHVRWSAGGHREALGGHGVRWTLRGIAVAALVLLGLGVPAAAFVAGGSQRAPGPSITPAVEMFMLQHAVPTDTMPETPVPAMSASTPRLADRDQPGQDEPARTAAARGAAPRGAAPRMLTPAAVPKAAVTATPTAAVGVHPKSTARGVTSKAR